MISGQTKLYEGNKPIKIHTFTRHLADRHCLQLWLDFFSSVHKLWLVVKYCYILVYSLGVI